MKVVILAGGYGTRLSEHTNIIPKPMVNIGGRPILWHIMKGYASFNCKEFFIAAGYKAEIIKDYFLNYRILNSDFKVDLKSGNSSTYNKDNVDWNVSIIDTGKNSMTGGRIKRLQKYIGNETFLLTYGDGLSNVNIDKLILFHKKHKSLITMTGVHPPIRFGMLDIEDNIVKTFKEKPSQQTKEGWINGGFMVVEPEVFDYIEDDKTIFEKEPLEKIAQMHRLSVFKHNGFWQCVDTKRELETLEKLSQKEQPPWTEYEL